jgi:hypothetical protein|tara:strand:+ start:2132 stop:2719 length:588 start_codon:yes stop_codon:yes gene_type:complete
MVDILDDLFPGDETIEDAPGVLDTLDMPPAQPGALQSLDAPVPGESLTSAPGSMLYEQPPQFTGLEDAAHAIFMSMSNENELRKVLQMLDSGVPVALIAESIVMFGASEGKWNIDMALLLLEPVSIMIAGFGSQAGINFQMTPPQPEPEDVDTGALEKIFKDKLGKKKDSLGTEETQKATEQVASMIQRPDKEPV